MSALSKWTSNIPGIPGVSLFEGKSEENGRMISYSIRGFMDGADNTWKWKATVIDLETNTSAETDQGWLGRKTAKRKALDSLFQKLQASSSATSAKISNEDQKATTNPPHSGQEEGSLFKTTKSSLDGGLSFVTATSSVDKGRTLVPVSSSTTSTSTDEDINKTETYVDAFIRAIKENGSISYCAVQCMPFGPPRVGKTCLYSRIIGQTPSAKRSTRYKLSCESGSTKVLEARKMVQVSATLLGWKEISVPEEMDLYMKHIQSHCKPSQQHVSSDEGSEEFKSLFNIYTMLGALKSISPYQGEASSQAAVVAQNLLENSVTIFYTDSGGQPEFQEILPALVAGPSIFLLVFSLLENFDSVYKVKYEPGSSDVYQEYESSFTVREALLQCLASIASYHKARKSVNGADSTHQDQSPPVTVLAIGTHKDLVDVGDVKKMDATLKESVANTVFGEECLIEPFSEDQTLIAVDNYDADDGKLVQGVIERMTSREKSKYRIDMPVPWLGVELALRQWVDEWVIKYQDCLGVAKQCNVPEKDLPKCLKFLHHHTGSIRYYEEVEELRNVVIIKPAVIFSAVTEFISVTFKTSINLEHFQMKVIRDFKTLGLFTKEDVEKIFSKQIHDKKFRLTLEQILALLQYLKILGKAHDKEFDYFLPCALVHAALSSSNENQLRSDYIQLLILFEIGFVPKGVFSGLLVVLCERGWRIERNQQRRPRLYRNQATFFDVSLKSSITLTVDLKHIVLEIPQEHSQEIKEILAESLSNVCSGLQYGNIWSFGVYCSDCKGAVSAHPAKLINESEAECMNTLRIYSLSSSMDTSEITDKPEELLFSAEYEAIVSAKVGLIDDLVCHSDCIDPLAQRLNSEKILPQPTLNVIVKDKYVIGCYERATKVVDAVMTATKYSPSALRIFIGHLKELDIKYVAESIEERLRKPVIARSPSPAPVSKLL